MNSPSQPAEPLSGNQDNNTAPTGNTFDQSTVQPRRSRRASSVLAASNTASKRPGAPSSDSAQSTAVSKKPKRKQKRSRGQPLPQPATEKVTQKQVKSKGSFAVTQAQGNENTRSYSRARGTRPSNHGTSSLIINLYRPYRLRQVNPYHP
ncbi:hypothetical protein PtB15_2B87 [Puccinia triticina]|nr:hypothetical protein PtB15_2B87 [Puccinia triticina]